MRRKRLSNELEAIARRDLNEFFSLINEVAHKVGKFIPFLFEKGKPKTEEQKEEEHKWLEEQKQIHAWEEEYPYEILALTRRDEGIVLIARGQTDKEMFENLDDAIQKGLYDNENEVMFFGGGSGRCRW